ncbi:unnamed protein product, partial [marine sediment metagenome]
LWLMVLSRVLLIPVIAALGYEVIYFGANHIKNALVRTVLAPGLWLQALRRTLSSGEVWFYSRSRQELWHKGETSGNRLLVRSVWKDCDSDTILVKAQPTGPVCHTGNKTCFFQQLSKQDIEAGHQEEG